MTNEVLGNARRISVFQEGPDWWTAKVTWPSGFTVQTPCATEELAHAWVAGVKWLPEEIAMQKFGLKF